MGWGNNFLDIAAQQFFPKRYLTTMVQSKRTYCYEWIDVLSDLSPLIKDMKCKASVENIVLDKNGFNLANCNTHCQLIARSVKQLIESEPTRVGLVEKLLNNLFRPKTLMGAFSELAIYDWLTSYDFGVKIQIDLDKSAVLGKNDCTIDGQLDLHFGQAYFDVKSFGFHGQMAQLLKEHLQSLIPEKAVFIEGSWDVSINDFEQLINNRNSIAQELRKNGMARHGRMTILCRERQPVMVSGSDVNPYLLAQENSLYPFKYSNQFTMEAPFLLIFVIHPWFGHSQFDGDFANTNSNFTRAFTRRVFMQYSNDSSLAVNFCGKVRDDVTLAEASRLLSGIVFANVWPHGCDDEEENLKHPSWIYLNPRATHPLSRSQFGLLYANGMTNVAIEDFEFDNYPF